MPLGNTGDPMGKTGVIELSVGMADGKTWVGINDGEMSVVSVGMVGISEEVGITLDCGKIISFEQVRRSFLFMRQPEPDGYAKSEWNTESEMMANTVKYMMQFGCSSASKPRLK